MKEETVNTIFTVLAVVVGICLFILFREGLSELYLERLSMWSFLGFSVYIIEQVLFFYSILLAVGLGNMIKNRALLPWASEADSARRFYALFLPSTAWIMICPMVLIYFGQDVGEWINIALTVALGYWAWNIYSKNRSDPK